MVVQKQETAQICVQQLIVLSKAIMALTCYEQDQVALLASSAVLVDEREQWQLVVLNQRI